MKWQLIILAFSTLLLSARGSAEQTDQVAPSFSLTALGGANIALEQHRGKVLFLAFWAPWCVPCKDELPELDRLYRKYRTEGLAVVGICEDSSEPAVSAFISRVPISFPIAIDRSSSAAEAYRILTLPSGYLIDRGGVIRQRYRGFEKKFVHTYEKDILELLQQPKP